jgi:hypothetical protein
MHDWQNIANLVPGRNDNQCHYKWTAEYTLFLNFKVDTNNSPRKLLGLLMKTTFSGKWLQSVVKSNGRRSQMK